MRSLILLLSLSSVTLCSELSRFDFGAGLEFPIPIGNSTTAENFTPMIGGAANVHWWPTRFFGLGAKFSADYFSDTEIKLDQVALVPRGEVAYRNSFSEQALFILKASGGAVFQQFKSRGDIDASNRSGAAWGASLALPVQKQDLFAVGPYVDMLFFNFSEDSSTEYQLNIGIAVTFTPGR